MPRVVFQFHVNLIKANKDRLHLCIRNTDINYECDRCPILIIVTLLNKLASTTATILSKSQIYRPDV